MSITRCKWAGGDPLLERYHDEEWGTPTFDDKKQFEHLCLEVMQCGLSWMTVLRKREAMRKAFDNFDCRKLADWDAEKIEKALEEPGIIRARRKIEAIVHNARRFLELQAQEGSFSKYLWDFVDGLPVRYPPEQRGGPTSELSDTISADLKKRGFKFVGSTNLYAHLQSVGIVNDHDEECFKANLPPVDPEHPLGKWVYVKMDRPIGTEHPKHPGLLYPINYGFIPGLLGGDGEEQDVYLLGVDGPVQSACGKVIAVVHRLDDNEDKWVASADGRDYSDEEIRAAVHFQEQYYHSDLLR